MEGALLSGSPRVYDDIFNERRGLSSFQSQTAIFSLRHSRWKEFQARGFREFQHGYYIIRVGAWHGVNTRLLLPLNDRSLSASQLAGGWFKGRLIPSTILKFILDKEERNQM
jgi:hypothetical protein